MPEALPDQPNLIGIIDALIDLFGASQDTTVESAALNRNSVFNDVIKSNMGIDNRTIDSLNGGESGLYALILSNKTLLESIINTNVVPGSSYMNYLVDIWNRNNSEEISEDDQYRELAHVLNLNEYYIFILSRTHQNNPFPTVSNVAGQGNNYSFSGLSNYPVARTTTKRMREEEIPPGSLVKIQYDNALTKDILSVIDIVEDTPEFTQMVLGAFAAESALVQVTNCARDSVFRGNHASGDQVGTTDNTDTDNDLIRRNLGNNNSIAYPFREGSTVDLVVILHGDTPYLGKTGQDIILNMVTQLSLTSTTYLVPKGGSRGEFEWDDIEEAINDLVSQGVTVNSRRLAAWSNGAKGFVNSIASEEGGGPGASYWDAFYLADPTPSINIFGSNFAKIPNGVYMEYNAANWSGGVEANFPDMADKIRATGGTAESVSQRHTEILNSILKLLN